MYQAGVLKAHHMPKLGGDEPTLLVPSNVMKMWKRPEARKPEAAQSVSKSKASTNGGDSLVAKSWSEADSLLPKVWKCD